jgi:hypothetical protein
MTARLINRTAKPVSGYGRVLPMSAVDADFWRLRRASTQPLEQPSRWQFWRNLRNGRIA